MTCLKRFKCFEVRPEVKEPYIIRETYDSGYYFISWILMLPGTNLCKMAQIILSLMYVMQSSMYNSVLLYIYSFLVFTTSRHDKPPRGMIKIDWILYFFILRRLLLFKRLKLEFSYLRGAS